MIAESRSASHCALRSFLAFGDGPRWSAGVQAALANVLPVAVFSIGGHLSLGLLSSLGAFTALCGTNLPVRERLRVLPPVASGFVAASALGVLCAASPWLTIGCLITVALVAGALLFRAELGPPGPMHLVLVAAVSAHVAIPEHLGRPTVSPIEIPILVAVGAISAYVVAAAPLVLTVAREQNGGVPLREMLSFPRWLGAEQSIITARVVVAVAGAGLLSVVLGNRHGYWIAMVAGAVLQASHVSRLSAIRAVQRVLGTFVGVVVFGVIHMANPEGYGLAEFSRFCSSRPKS